MGNRTHVNRKWELREEPVVKTIRIPPHLLDLVEQVKGNQSLNAFVVKAIEKEVAACSL